MRSPQKRISNIKTSRGSSKFSGNILEIVQILYNRGSRVARSTRNAFAESEFHISEIQSCTYYDGEDSKPQLDEESLFFHSAYIEIFRMKVKEKVRKNLFLQSYE